VVREPVRVTVGRVVSRVSAVGRVAASGRVRATGRVAATGRRRWQRLVIVGNSLTGSVWSGHSLGDDLAATGIFGSVVTITVDGGGISSYGNEPYYSQTIAALAGAGNMLLLWGLSNDLGYSGTTDAIEAAVVAYMARVKGDVPTVSRIVATEISRGTPGMTQDYETRRQIINPWERVSYKTFSEYAPIDLEATVLGPANAYLDGTYFRPTPDYVHLVSAGVTVASTKAAADLRARLGLAP
jgi:hypothetical protein